MTKNKKLINIHDELVEALKGLVARFEIEGFKCNTKICNCSQFMDNDWCRHIIAKQALSKAGGKE